VVNAPSGDPARVVVTSSSGRELVNAGLQATYLDSKGVLAPPPGIAGWYAEQGWPKPGAPGASILVGHINYRGGPDVFWNLTSAKPGDVVTVTYGSGKTVKFQVTKSRAVSKKAVPKDTSIWDWQNPQPLLRLITCDPETPLQGGHYEGNWVVWATPLA
jgi:LPXTG-site transpeptidase (sortase) family protein